MTISGFVKLLKLISDKLNTVAKWVSIFFMGMVTILVFASVVSRMMGNAISWSEELARWFLIGTTFIGSSVAIRKGSHVGVTVMVKLFPVKVKKLIITIANLTVIVFLCYIFYYGTKSALVATGMMGDIIQVSMVYVKMTLPVGAGLMIIHLLYYLFGIIEAEDPEDFLISNPTA